VIKQRKTIGIFSVLFLLVVNIEKIIILNNRTRIEQLNQRNSDLKTISEISDSLDIELAYSFNKIEEYLTFVRSKRNPLILNPIKVLKISFSHPQYQHFKDGLVSFKKYFYKKYFRTL